MIHPVTMLLHHKPQQDVNEADWPQSRRLGSQRLENSDTAKPIGKYLFSTGGVLTKSDWPQCGHLGSQRG